MKTVKCVSCGSAITIKNWTALSIWRRKLPRRCRTCISTSHGMARTRLHRIWAGMRSRCGITKCSNPSAYKYYIERGIGICDAWDDFAVFAKWALSHGYTDRMTLDRKKSDKGYSPENCRWVTMKENLRSRVDRKLTMEKAQKIRALKGVVPAADVAAQYGLTRNYVYEIWADRRWV